MKFTPELDAAAFLAGKAHAGQVRKYTGEPYIVHPEDVVQRLRKAGAPQPVQIAGFWHDVLEDVFPSNPLWNVHLIQEIHGPVVARIVVEVTNVFTKSAYPRLNRAARHRKEVERLSTISPEGKALKLADILSNTANVVKEDPEFAAGYLEEKLELLPRLGLPIMAPYHHALFNQANRQVRAQLEILQSA